MVVLFSVGEVYSLLRETHSNGEQYILLTSTTTPLSSDVGQLLHLKRKVN